MTARLNIVLQKGIWYEIVGKMDLSSIYHNYTPRLDSGADHDRELGAPHVFYSKLKRLAVLVHGAGFRVQGAGCRRKGEGGRGQGSGCSGCRVQGPRCSVQDSESKRFAVLATPDAGCRV
jgi:hypothetical protein